MNGSFKALYLGPLRLLFMNLPAESLRDVFKCLDSRSLVAAKLTNRNLRDFVRDNSAVLAIIRQVRDLLSRMRDVKHYMFFLQSRCRLFVDEARNIFLMLDQVSLASCSLVCYQWMHVTRKLDG